MVDSIDSSTDYRCDTEISARCQQELAEISLDRTVGNQMRASKTKLE